MQPLKTPPGAPTEGTPGPPGTSPTASLWRTPAALRALLATLVIVAASELVSMLLLASLPPLPMVTRALVDAALLTLVAGPLLYLFVARPLGRAVLDGSARAGRRRLHEVLDAMADGVVLVDERGRMVFVNDRLERMLGYDAGELGGRSIELLVPPAARRQHVAQRQEYEASPTARSLGEPLSLAAQRKDGESIPVSISLSPVETEEGPRTLAIVTDLSELHRAWRESDLLGRAVEQSGEVVVVTDLDGTIRYVNPAFEKVTGYTREEAMGQTPRILRSGRHDDAFYRRMYDVLERGDVWRSHFVNRRKDGSFYDQYASISRVRDRTGKPLSYVAVGRDITSELELEAQLRQSQKMDALGRLAGGIAHDFNNLLTAISGHAEMAMAGGEEAQEDLLEIRRVTARAAELTRQLLTFSRKQPAGADVVDLNAVTRRTELMLRRVIGEHIELVSALAAESQPVMADPGQLEQVILNLAVNARDAMPQGGTLTLRTYRAPETAVPRDGSEGERRAPSYVALEVSDTGTGMDRKVLTRIFEPFFTTKPAGKGTGLGLATAYGIVRHFDGAIDVDSTPGAGTRFTVYLPFAGASA